MVVGTMIQFRFRWMSLIALVGLASSWAAHANAQAKTLLSEDFSSAVPGTHSGGVISGTQFQVTESNVDIVGVLNGSFFTCTNDLIGNCCDLVGNAGSGAIASVATFDLAADVSYGIDFNAILQGFPPADPSVSQISVSLGSFSETLLATPVGNVFSVRFTPLADEAGAQLGFTTLTAPDSVHGAVLDNIMLFTVELEGDFDIDGDIDGFDFLKWQRGESPNPLSAEDLAVWQENFGSVASSALATPTGVPEPATGIILMLGMAAMLFRRQCT